MTRIARRVIRSLSKDKNWLASISLSKSKLYKRICVNATEPIVSPSTSYEEVSCFPAKLKE